MILALEGEVGEGVPIPQTCEAARNGTITYFCFDIL